MFPIEYFGRWGRRSARLCGRCGRRTAGWAALGKRRCPQPQSRRPPSGSRISPLRCYSLDGVERAGVLRLDQGPHRTSRGLVEDGAAWNDHHHREDHHHQEVRLLLLQELEVYIALIGSVFSLPPLPPSCSLPNWTFSSVPARVAPSPSRSSLRSGLKEVRLLLLQCKSWRFLSLCCALFLWSPSQLPRVFLLFAPKPPLFVFPPMFFIYRS